MSFLKQFNYQILGFPSENPPLVFLHGLMGFAQNWRRVANAFQKERLILIFDQRGHGKSIKPDVGYKPEDYAEDLYLILEDLNWPQIDLVGHSMGGRNALNFAFRFPTRVRRLVIEDIGPVVAEDSLERIQGRIDLVPTPFTDKLSAKEFFMNEFPRRLKGSQNAQTLGAFFYANLEERLDGRVDWRFNVEAIFSSLREGRVRERWHEWDELIVPTLIIRGESSEDLSREIFDEMLNRNRLSRGIEVIKAGHWVHFDQPEVFIKVLSQFLDANDQEIFTQNFDILGTSS